MKRSALLLLLIGLCCMPAWLYAQAESKEAPTITITKAPPLDPGGPDKMATIEGSVTKPCQNCRVVVYAHGDIWYVQPYAATPFTTIRADGTWRNQTHLGTEYAALLVKPGYRPPPTSPDLPEVSGDVVALTVAEGRK